MLMQTQADPVRIVLAERQHLRRIPAIELAGASLFAETDLPQNLRYRVTDAKTLREAQVEHRMWIALNSTDQAIGFAMADVVDGMAHLDELDVVPEYGRRGIGSRLLQVVRDWAANSGYQALTLVTFRHLPWNAPFYAKKGFVELKKAELSGGLASLIEEEVRAGIDIRNRIAMKLPIGSEGGQW
jgi:GNAT superfamily N-acetyltransferase